MYSELMINSKPKKDSDKYHLLNRKLLVPVSVSLKILSRITILDITLIKQDSKIFLPPNLFSLLNVFVNRCHQLTIAQLYGNQEILI